MTSPWKTKVLFALLTFCIFLTSAMATNYDWSKEANTGTWVNIAAGSGVYLACRFIPNETTTITTMGLMAAGAGLSGGSNTINFRLYSDSSGLPGSILQSTTGTASTFTSGGIEYNYTINFNITKNNAYWFALGGGNWGSGTLSYYVNGSSYHNSTLQTNKSASGVALGTVNNNNCWLHFWKNSTPPEETFIIYANDIVSGASINNFNATISRDPTLPETTPVRELQFPSQAYVIADGGTITGSPTFSDDTGVTLVPGQSIIYSTETNRTFTNGATIYAEFIPKFLPGDGSFHTIERSGPPYTLLGIYKHSSNSLYFVIGGSENAAALADYQNYWYTNKTNYIVATGSNAAETKRIYLNGHNLTIVRNTGTDFYLYNYAVGSIPTYPTGEFNGSIKEIKILNYTITDAEAKILSTPEHHINNITLNTTSGSIITELPPGSQFLWNVTLCSKEYFCESYNRLNISDALYGKLSQSYLLIEAFNNITRDRLYYFNSSFGSSKNSTNNGTSFLTINGGTQYLNFSADGYYPLQYSVTYANVTSNYYKFDVFKLKVNVTCTDFATGLPIQNFTTTVIRQDLDFAFTSSNTTFNYVTDSFLENGTYNITIISDGYAFINTILQLNTSIQLNFTLLTTNYFNITFLDVQTKSIINTETIYLSLVGDHYSINTTTTTGNISLPVPFPDSYDLRYYGGTSYPTHFYFFNVINGTYNNLPLYLHKNTIASNITVIVVDEFNQKVENALVDLERYDISINEYTLQQSMYSNAFGKTFFQAQLFGEKYKFLIFYNGVLKTITEGTLLDDTSYIIPINIGETLQEKYNSRQNVGFSIRNDSSNIIFTYADADNTADTAVVYLYEKEGTLGEQALLSITSALGSSSTIIVPFIPVNESVTYTAYAFVNKSGETYFMTLYSIERKSLEQQQADFGKAILWGIVILTTVLFFFALPYSGSIALVILPIPFLCMTILEVTRISMGIALGMSVVFWIMAYVVAK